MLQECSAIAQLIQFVESALHSPPKVQYLFSGDSRNILKSFRTDGKENHRGLLST